MRCINHKWFWAMFFALLIGTAGQAQIRVVAQVNDSEPIYVGKRFALHISIYGDDQPGQVDIGQKVRVVFEPAGDNLQIPQWELTETAPPNQGD